MLAGPTLLNGTGNTPTNVIEGNDGANTLQGLGGNDTLSGGANNDTLVGGQGTDMLVGGAGADRFQINALTDSTVAAPDVIDDFTFTGAHARPHPAQRDRREHDAPLDQAFTYRGANFTGAAGDLRVQSAGVSLLARLGRRGR